MAESKAFRGARKRGYDARRHGYERDRCPYPDFRTGRGSVTFSRGFRRAWLEGWDAANRGEPWEEEGGRDVS